MNDLKLYILNNKKYLIIPLILFFVLGFIFYRYLVEREELNNENISFDLSKEVYTENTYKKENVVNEPTFIVVDIKGRVKKPGIYRIDFALDRRISDIVTMAGGLLNDADTSVTNLSKKVFDEMVIIIYSKEEVKNFLEVKEEEIIKNDICDNQCDSCIEKDNVIDKNPTTSDNENENNDNLKELININNASIEELMTLPGIGESKAVAIIEYRKNTSFKTIEEIMNVSGIGESVYNKIKNYIKI